MDTKALRQKILDLAIHGKLVPQDPNDEPASALLQRISETKERLIKEGKIKKCKKSAKTSDAAQHENVPFEVPESWEWTTLGEISDYGKSINISVDEIGDKEWVLELEDIEKDTGIIVQQLNKEERQINGVRHKFRKGDILYSKLRTYLNKVLVASKDGYCTTEIMAFNTYGGLLNNYICHVLRSQYFLDYTQQCGYGVKMPRLSTTDACNGFIPLPPLPEQRRIVAEIERWFSLIDIIEIGKAGLQTAVKQAKAKILDLAIHGKLVPHDPADEPAADLLRRINPKAETASDNDGYGTVPFEVPDSWVWTTLGEISDYGKSINISVDEIGDKEWVLELEDIEKDTGIIVQQLNKEERQINGVRHKFRKGDILYSKLRTYLNKVLVASKDGYCTTEIMAFNTYGGLLNNYICHVLRSQYFLDYTQQCGYGVKMPRLSTTDACNGFIPLPPLSEQCRIVAKVEELFAQLDLIEAQILCPTVQGR